MPTQSLSVHEFLSQFFIPGDVLEIRGLPTRKEGPGRPTGPASERYFLGDLERLPEFHDRLNWYFGAATRKRGSAQGTKEDLAHATHLWADMDGVTARESMERVANAGLPRPSIINGSGHGAHVFWKLDKTVDLVGGADCSVFEKALKVISELIGSDPQTCNADRILRIPGTMNIKREPHTPCHVLEANDASYPLKAFLPQPKDFIRMVWQASRRHDLALGIAAWMKARNISLEEAKGFIEDVCTAAKDEEVRDRVRAVEDTYHADKAAYKERFERNLGFLTAFFRGCLEVLFASRSETIDPHRWRIIEEGPRHKAGPYLAPNNTIHWLVERHGKDGSWNEWVHVVGAPIEYRAFLNLDGDFVIDALIENQWEFQGNPDDLAHRLHDLGLVTRDRLLRDCLDAVRVLSTDNGAPIYKGHAAVGVYQDADGLALTTRAPGRQPPQVETRNEVLKVDLEVKDGAFAPWAQVAAWYTPREGLLLMGWSAIAPFFFELKNALEVKGDYTPYPFLIGNHGLGKSTLNRIFTTMLHGTPERAAKSIDSEFRMAQYFNSTTLPLHIAECDQFDFDMYSAKFKAAAESPALDARGRRDLSMETYFARAPMTFDANRQPIEDENLIIRFLIVPFEKSEEAVRKEKRMEFKRFLQLLRPVGPAMLREICEALNNRADEKGLRGIEVLMQAVRRIETRLGDYGIPFVDARRSYAWALIYAGLELWKQVFDWHHVPWDLPALDTFVEDVITPIEATMREEYGTTKAAQFRAWFEMWLEKNLIVRRDYTEYRGSGIVWDQDNDYFYVTFAVLTEFSRNLSRGDKGYKSLKHLAREVADLWGGTMNEIHPPGGRKLGGKTKKVVRIPKGDMTRVDEAPPGTEPLEDVGGADARKRVLAVLRTRMELIPERPVMTEEEVVDATGLSAEAVHDTLIGLRQVGEIFCPESGKYRSVETL